MPAAPPSADAISTMKDMLGGFSRTAMLYAVTRFGIPDLLADGPQTAEALAEKAGVNADNLARLLKALCLHGVFGRTQDGRFALTELGQTLRSGGPASLAASVLGNGVDWWYRSWGDLYHAVETGQPAFDRLHGQDFWSFLRDHPEAEQVFNRRRSNSADQLENSAVLEAWDFSGISSVVDIGAGYGALAAAILEAIPGARATWFDLPHAEAGARRLMTERGLSERCRFVAGSMFDQVPPGHDLLLLKNVIHNWQRPDIVRLFARCRAAMDENSRLLVIDGFLTDDSPMDLHMLDLTMMVMMTGQYVDQNEIDGLLGEAGLRLVSLTPTAAPRISIAEAVPA